jgi:hypothetical protein
MPVTMGSVAYDSVVGIIVSVHVVVVYKMSVPRASSVAHATMYAAGVCRVTVVIVCTSSRAVLGASGPRASEALVAYDAYRHVEST